MKHVYFYLYYRAYDLLSLTGDYDQAWGASHFMSVYFSCFLIKLILLFPIPYSELLKIGVVSLCLIIQLFNYLIFVRNDNFKKIIARHENEARQTKLFGRIAVIVFSALLVCFLFY
jgi:hypothetical protein